MQKICSLCGWRTDFLVHGKGWCDLPGLTKAEFVAKPKPVSKPSK